MSFPSANFNWTPETREVAERLWTEGKSAAEIARILKNPSRSSVIGMLHRRKLQGVVRATPARPDRAPKAKAAPKHRARAPVHFANPGTVTSAEPKAPYHGKLDAFAPLPGMQPVPFGSPGCRWPVGGSGAEMLCCGVKRADTGSYCEAPAELSSSKWQPASDQPVEALKWRLRA